MFVKEIYLSNEPLSTIRNRINLVKVARTSFIGVGYVFKSRWFLASLIWNGGTLRKNVWNICIYCYKKCKLNFEILKHIYPHVSKLASELSCCLSAAIFKSIVACWQALQFGRAKRSTRERVKDLQSREGRRKGRALHFFPLPRTRDFLRWRACSQAKSIVTI